MADLYDRITATGESTQKIAVHSFASSLREWSRGAVTKAQIVSAFSLGTEEEGNLDSIASVYQGKPNANSKTEYLVKIHDVFILCEAGLYTKAKAKSELGF